MKYLMKIVIASFLLTALGVQAETLNVIVNKSVAIDALDRQAIRKVFLGKAVKLPSGAKLVPVDIDERDDLYEVFCRKVVGKSPAQISSHWSRRIFNGKGIPPKQLANAREITNLVASDTTYISYVVGDVKSSDVKVVFSIDF